MWTGIWTFSWCYLTMEAKLCDRETLAAVNYLFGWMLSGSIRFKSEEFNNTFTLDLCSVFKRCCRL